MDVLISGASIAGPALAFWLARYGFSPTVVEIAPALRTGGNAVDFRGPLHLGLLRRMGVLEELRQAQTGGTAMRFEDAAGHRLMELPREFAGGELEVLRGDLSRVLAEAAGPGAEYLFGDTVTAMTETPDAVEVTFRSGRQRRFDLVVGADGVHSTVRRLAFGPEQRYVRHLGYHVAGWDVPNRWGLSRDWRAYNVPGRMVSIGGDHRDPARAAAFVAFSSPRLDYDRHDVNAQRQILRDRFGDLGWEVPGLLADLAGATDLYFDQICRVDVPSFHRGRIALVGDAASGATIGGQGNGTAMVAAYALAGELALAGGDHRVAFPRYEQRIAKFARGTQKGGDTTGRFLAPRTARGIRIRNAVHDNRLGLWLMLRIAAQRSTNVELPDYQSLVRR